MLRAVIMYASALSLLLTLVIVSTRSWARTDAILAYESLRGDVSSIYVRDAQRGIERQVTDATRNAYEPEWSPDWKLAYTFLRATRSFDIAILDVSSGLTQTAVETTAEPENTPRWLMDGRLSYVRFLLPMDILILTVPGDAPTVVVSGPGVNRDPCWLGQEELVFASDRDSIMDLYLLNTESGVLQRLTYDPAPDYNAACSHDGQLAFATTRDMNAEVYIIDPITLVETNMTQSPRSAEFNPAWLPDGRLSFVSDRSGNREIYILNSETSDWENVTNNPYNDNEPSWIPTS